MAQVSADEPSRPELIDSVRRVLGWMLALPPAARHRFASALAECEDTERGTAARLLEGAAATESLAPPVVAGSQAADFSERLRARMDAKCITQQELAERVGVSQPAISQLLNRHLRPRRATILKLAEALGTDPRELWPDLETAESADAVADFQEDGRVMSDAEAAALGPQAPRNPPTIPVRSLPVRRR